MIIVEWQIMTETVILGESGRIVLPAAIRKELGLEPGVRLTIISEPYGIRIMTRKMALESIRAGIIEKRGSLKGLLDEFIAERHAEATREANE
jgi:AbrB family looped-hinge helix DNA binding protein